jgi:hypothetical protein
MATPLNRFPDWDPERVRVTRKELRLFSFLSAIFAIILFLPYVYLYLTTPSDLVFSGNIYDVHDHNIYFSWIYQAAEGKILWKNLFTSIPHEGAVFNLYFFMLGQLVRLTGMSLDCSYQIGRLFTSWLLGISVYYFVSLFFQGKNRFWCWLAAMCSEGLGWLVQAILYLFDIHITKGEFLSLSIDTWIWEGFAFASALYTPLASLAISFLLFILRWTYIAIFSSNIRTALLAGAAFLLVSYVHPYDVIIIATIIFGMYVLLMIFYPQHWSRWTLHAGIICLLGLPSIFYNYWILTHNPGLIPWRSQAIGWSPWPLCYIVGFGIPFLGTMLWLLRQINFKIIFLLFVALIVVVFLRREGLVPPGTVKIIIYYFGSILFFLFWHIKKFRNDSKDCLEKLIVTVWVILIPLLLYAPFTLQRRLDLGFIIPLCVLFFDWILTHSLSENWSRARFKTVLISLIFLSSLTSLDLYYHAFHARVTFYRYNFEEYYIDPFIKKEQIKAFNLMHDKKRMGSVLSSFTTGNQIPRYTGLPVVLGATSQTENFAEMVLKVKSFYSCTASLEESERFLQEKNVAYIFYGPEEQRYDVLKIVPVRLKALGWELLSGTFDSSFQIFVLRGKHQ